LFKSFLGPRAEKGEAEKGKRTKKVREHARKKLNECKKRVKRKNYLKH